MKYAEIYPKMLLDKAIDVVIFRRVQIDSEIIKYTLIDIKIIYASKRVQSDSIICQLTSSA